MKLASYESTKSLSVPANEVLNLNGLQLSVGVLIVLLTAYFNADPIHPDEYFQIIEFASYKLGISPASDLPWEFQERLRPWLQPLLATIPMLIAESFSLTRTQGYFLVRAFFGFLMLGAVHFFIRHCSQYISERAATLCRRWYFLVFFVSFLAVRPSSESFCFTLCLFALGWVDIWLASSLKKAAVYAGIFFGLSFIVRFQALSFFLGFLLWFLVYQRQRMRELGGVFGGFLLAFLLGLFCDRIGYSNWTLSTFNFFKFNVIEGGAATFGVEPWYFFILELGRNSVISPFQTIAILSLLIYLSRCRNSLMSFVWLSFFIVNSIPAHKEPRFIFPLFLFLPFFFFEVYSIPNTKWLIVKQSKWFAIMALFLVIANFIALSKRILKPKRKNLVTIALLEGHPGEEICLEGSLEDPFFYTNLNMSYLKNQNLPRILYKKNCPADHPSIRFVQNGGASAIPGDCELTLSEPWWRKYALKFFNYKTHAVSATEIWKCP